LPRPLQPQSRVTGRSPGEDIYACMHAFINMVKTITIKDEVYRELASLKRERESFSDVIMKLLSRRRIDLFAFYGAFENKELWKEVEKDILTDRRRVTAR